MHRQPVCERQRVPQPRRRLPVLVSGRLERQELRPEPQRLSWPVPERGDLHRPGQ